MTRAVVRDNGWREWAALEERLAAIEARLAALEALAPMPEEPAQPPAVMAPANEQRSRKRAGGK